MIINLMFNDSKDKTYIFHLTSTEIRLCKLLILSTYTFVNLQNPNQLVKLMMIFVPRRKEKNAC